jgi:hypothetical protein
MRNPLWFLASLLMIAASSPVADRPIVRFAPVPLDRTDPSHVEQGPLHYVAGWKVTSNRSDFGGISSLLVQNASFLALSDTGIAYRFHFTGDERETSATFIKLPAGPGQSDAKEDRDSESMVVDPLTGDLWVGFEGWNAIWRYSASLGEAKTHAEPEMMAQWPKNLGPEAMVRMKDGRFLVIAEASHGRQPLTDALLFPGDPTEALGPPIKFSYQPPADFSPTDAAQLPDGRILVLNRYYSVMGGVAAALTLIDPAAIREAAIVTGKEIARLTPPMTVDNMEGLSIEQDDRGETILWITSDDNFNPLQQTLLLKFRLDTTKLPKS